ncbi:MAG: tetratricopeptide repeat protein [Thiomonas sp.]|nr:tetratricopeptide repeat protein [Thiomonas sp.]
MRLVCPSESTSFTVDLDALTRTDMTTTPFNPSKDQLLLAEINAAFNGKNYPHVIHAARIFLKKNPNHAPTLHQYALALIHTGRQKEAKPLLQRVVALAPNEVLPLFHLARVHQDLKELFDAQKIYIQLIKRWPETLDAYASYGSLLQSAGRLKEAEQLYRTAISIAPSSFINRRNLAALLLTQGLTQGDKDEAFEIYQDLWEKTRSHIAGMELADLLTKNGQYDQAITLYKEILDSGANRVPALLGLAEAHQKQGDNDKAIAYYQNVLESSPENAHALLKLANLLSTRKEEADRAALLYQKGQALHPDNPLFNLGLANLYERSGQVHKAMPLLSRLHRQHPEKAEFLFSLANLFFASGDFSQAEKLYRDALWREPNSLTSHSNLFYVFASSGCDSNEQRENELRRFGARLSRMRLTDFQYKNTEDVSLNIGFVSADLHNHPVGHFMDAVLSAIHQRHHDKIKVFIYSNSTTVDSVSERIQASSAAWRAINSLTDQEAAELIHHDDIHILIDLAGHTGANRLAVFARRPAPVQVTWLGYFATTGVNEIDYLLCDPWSQADQAAEFFSEALWPLPETRLCFTPPEFDIAPQRTPSGTRSAPFFGCFNQYLKLNDEVIETWSKILLQLPHSTLFLKTRHLADPELQAELMAKFQAQGISANRLILEGESSREDYLACFNRIDISLDPFPYTGGTTTVESLWMGVPVLTLAGQTLIGRQGLGLLMNAGLPNWVAYSKEEYIAKAVAWAGKIDELAQLRPALRQQVLASPLFDADRFARHFTQAMTQMWERHLQNPAPRPIRWPDYPLDSDFQGTVRVVSATQKTEAEFWAESALGRSLPYHLERDARIKPQIAFANRRGLPEIFNAAIEAADDGDILVFMHDDVWLDELGGLTKILREGLVHFDVWGVAGNKRRLPGQVGWGHLDDNLKSDQRINFTGRIAHGKEPYGATSYFGGMPAPCELLDGVFLVTQKSRLQPKKVRFDPKFDFHLYDIDFCRSARKAGLRLGTWPIELTHQSQGSFFSTHWRKKAQLYLKKWGN